jgi:hypothetical protein
MIKLKGGDTERTRMMAKAMSGGLETGQQAGNALANQLGMPSARSARDQRALARGWELKKQPEGPVVYIESASRVQEAAEDDKQDESSDLSDFEVDADRYMHDGSSTYLCLSLRSFLRD